MIMLKNKNKLKKRLDIVQKELFKNQINKNKLLEKKIVSVLVENQMKDRKKLF